MKKKAKEKEIQKTSPEEAQEREQSIAEYLWTHSDFFARHPDLLRKLTIPHPSGAAISLVERQLALLREQNRELKQQLHDLIENAVVNDDLSKKVHQLALGVLTAATPQAAIEVLFSSLQTGFDVDVIALRLFFDGESLPPSLPDHFNVVLVSRHAPELEVLASVLKSSQPICGRLTGEQRDYLFGEEVERAVSCALIPLGRDQRRGVLAMGSQEPDRFRADLGTMFLDYLGVMVEQVLHRHWP
ncbi:DUF484 family protein [Nitrosococcus watsonii]|uniref:Phytochrome sensor protein n=1 Tax=Nitrosococcus watsoni (strain C-113) TaxID=105559 RepID=D8KA63_NITWC|nr:DUF484 family protein [Nitrosococcus watsonii]ADJ27378.1 protein of unknown function DUF484 [Nitrosococcus watsonii C-113]